MDDNIRFLKEITETCPQSLFDHPYLAMYRHLHEAFGMKVQLNLFYKMDGFDLSQVTEAYYSEWENNSDWLKLSFHSEQENVKPYMNSKYDEVFEDCKKVNEQIKRFASPAALADTTTIHYCVLTAAGVKAVLDNGVCGLLGLFGNDQAPRTSYGIEESHAAQIRSGEVVTLAGISYGSIDIVLNRFSAKEILEQLAQMLQRNSIRVMIHEQYFYQDYKKYQPEFEEKLYATFSFLTKHGYQSRFFEELIP